MAQAHEDEFIRTRPLTPFERGELTWGDDPLRDVAEMDSTQYAALHAGEWSLMGERIA